MSTVKKSSSDTVTHGEWNKRSIKSLVGAVSIGVFLCGTFGTFLYYGLTQCGAAIEGVSEVRVESLKAVGELKEEHDDTFHLIASRLGAHEAAQVESMRRIDGSLDSISETLKEQNTEMREQRTMIQTILRNNGSH